MATIPTNADILSTSMAKPLQTVTRSSETPEQDYAEFSDSEEGSEEEGSDEEGSEEFSPAITTFEGKLKHLRNAIVHKPPFCAGQFSLSAEEMVIFYATKDGGARLIDFSAPSEDDLRLLEEACDPAKFGLGQENILDETYRKAGKLDWAKFALKFDPDSCGLLDGFRSDLLEGHKDKTIRAELYKLNVYGPGSFFKAHKDTPRSEDMFGSLILVLPTHHVGGALEFSHRGSSWSFDTASMVWEDEQPRIAYVAFYSDVEHAVKQVESGYRVTLTYNLYFADSVPDEAKGLHQVQLFHEPPTHAPAFKDALKELLNDPMFLPEGGLLGFGLQHQYAFRTQGESIFGNPLTRISRRLKGSDAVVMDACMDLGADVTIKAIYQAENWSNTLVMLDRLMDGFAWEMQSEAIHEELCEHQGGVMIRDEDEAFTHLPQETVHWVTELTEYTKHEETYAAYGNEASVGYVYGSPCLIIEIPRKSSA